MTSSTPMSNMTAADMFDSLTGFEEMGVVKMFGRPVTDYGRKGRAENPLMLVRALIYVAAKRDGSNDATAYKAAMTLPSREVQDYFDPDPDDTDEPEGDEGDEDEAAELEDDDEGKAPSGA